MEDLKMPQLSDSVEEGEILEWLKAVGDEIAVGDELVEIETDKANLIHESEVAGVLLEIVAEAGSVITAGTTIARIGQPGESLSDPAAGSAQGASGQSTTPVEDAGTEAPQDAGSRETAVQEAPARKGRIKATPVARRIAAENDLDLSGVPGSGPNGRILKKDVIALMETGSRPGPAVATEDGPTHVTVELSRLQKTVARRMASSKSSVPHFYLTTEIDLSRCLSARSALKANAGEGDVVPSINDFIVKAAALTLRDHPKANGSYVDDSFRLNSEINVGVAVAAEDALIVPTVRNADRLGLTQISLETRRLARQVRERTIAPADLDGGTFTVSNLGMYGITQFDAVINEPQAAILAVGSTSDRLALEVGELVTRSVLTVTLSCDHRILYGAEGAAFLADLRKKLEEPVSLALG